MWRVPGSAGAAAGAARPAGGPDAADMVVPVRYRDLVGDVLRGPLQLSVPSPVRSWAFLVAALAVVCLLQWGLARATGIRLPFRNLRYRHGPSGGFARRGEVRRYSDRAFLIVRGLTVAAIGVAALGVAAEVALQQAPCGHPPGVAGRPRPSDRQAGPAHSPITRLSICGLLAAGASWVEFAAMRDAAGISDSVLSKQSRVLEEAGYVEVRRRGRPAAAHLVPAHRGRPTGARGSSGLAGPAGEGGLWPAPAICRRRVQSRR